MGLFKGTEELLEVGKVYQTKPNYFDAGTEYKVIDSWVNRKSGVFAAAVENCITGECMEIHGTVTDGLYFDWDVAIRDDDTVSFRL